MKIARLCLLVATVALLGGCTNVPSQDAARIRAAFRSYLSLVKGEPHARVVSLLGNEFRRDSEGAFIWEVRYDSLNYTSIRIRFDSNNRVQDTNVSRGWGDLDSASQKAPAEHEN
jgi:hypothetical protein